MPAKLIAPGLYAIVAGQVNTFLLDHPNGCVLIDTGFPGSADTILQAVREVGKQPRDIKHLLLTHAHPDHIGSAAALKQATGAQTYMHALDAPIAQSGKGFRPMTPAPGLMNSLLFRAFVRTNSSVDPTPIDHLVSDGDVLPIAGGLRAIHAPGHCAGQLVFLWPQHGGVLVAADTCSHVMGLGLSIGYEDLDEGRGTLRTLAQLTFDTSCFGHGKAIAHGASAQFQSKWG